MRGPLDHALPLIRSGVHLLVGALLVICLLSGIGGSGPRWGVIGGTALMAVVYVVGLGPWAHRHPVGLQVWGAILTVSWVLLVVETPMAVWLAFPLFFLAAHLLPGKVALPVVAGLTVIAVVGFAGHQGRITVGGVVGPVLGALVAVATVAGLREVHRASTARGVLEERDRLAREIHDTIAQGLNSIHLLLGAADGQLEQRPARARELIGQARSTAADNLEEARRLVRALGPADLATRSLVDALTRIVDRESGVTLVVSGDPAPLPVAQEVALLRIAQEAVGNAVRHADAEKVTVTLTYLPDAVALDVVDDGNGDVNEVGGFGMTSMRQRAGEVGGRLAVESSPGHGSAIAVTVARDPA